MYILMDLVVNHCSDEHEWFEKACEDPDGEYGNFFYIEDRKEGELPCNWRSYFGGPVWEPLPGHPDKQYMHVFHKKQPDLNWENPKMRKEIYAMMNYWIDKGISGFPNPLESPYDAFVAGHASNSISAAMGMSVASALKGEKDRHVIAVIGDGAMTGGLAFEGLNNASANPNNLLIILNDNDMAIDHAVGGLSQYLVDITTSQAYNKMRYDVYRGLRKMKLINNDRRGNILRFNNSLKALLTQQHNLFEGFSIRYFGPVDGHDVNYLVKVLNDNKRYARP